MNLNSTSHWWGYFSSLRQLEWQNFTEVFRKTMMISEQDRRRIRFMKSREGGRGHFLRGRGEGNYSGLIASWKSRVLFGDDDLAAW
jgi:hypothetical protein